MELVKDFKKATIITSTIYIILGIVMIFNPKVVSNFVCYILGAIILLYGMIQIISFFVKNEEKKWARVWYND